MTTKYRRLIPAALAVLVLALGGCAPDVMAHPGGVPPTEPTAAVDEPMPTPSGTPEADESPTPEPSPRESETPAAQPAPQESEPPSPAPEPSPSEPTTTPPPPAIIDVGDEGEKVRELQSRLQQIEWFEGKITPNYGDQTRLAVEGFQAKRGIPVLGYVDQVTWDRLLAMTRMPTHDEMHNILTPGPTLLAEGAKGDDVKDLQARLKQIAWYFEKVDGIYGAKTVEAVRGFQEKREIPVTGEVDQRTLDRLHGMTHKPTTDELNNVAPKPGAGAMTLDDRCLQGRVVCISKEQRKLAWVIDGEIQMTMDVRFGSELTPTRNGVFAVNWKSRDHVSSIYDTAMPYALFFSGGQAVHYSADFAARGYNGASHGCVNVRDKAAVSALFDAAKVGDKVVVYTG
ncbi:L,D-transpeptidase family protein [Tessaracoccus terricola]